MAGQSIDTKRTDVKAEPSTTRRVRLGLRKPGVALGLAAALACSIALSASADQAALVAGMDDPMLATVTTPPISLPTLLELPEVPTDILADPTPQNNHSPILWGYEANVSNSKIFEYNMATGGTFIASCTPAGSQNGRGLAMDPLDGNLWYTHVSYPGFNGDHMVHKVTPPLTTSVGCLPVTTLTVDPAVPQDDYGAIDIDQGSKHLWLAGYKPVIVGGVARSYLYLINRNNGKLLQSCWVPFGGGGVGNDSLAYARIGGLPGSGQYLLTDAGEVATPHNGNTLQVVDTSSCHKGQPATIVATFAKRSGMTGIEYEWPGLINTDGHVIQVGGTPPSFVQTGPTIITGTTFELEDIAACGYRAIVDGDANDQCPYSAP